MRSSDDLAKLLQLARVPIFDVGLDGKLLSFNEAAGESLGFSEESVGRDLLELLPEAGPLGAALEAARALDATSSCALPGPVELRRKGAEGRSDTLLVLKLVLQLEGGAKSVTAIGQDLGEVGQKAVEDKKKALNAIVTQEVRTPLHGMVGLATVMEKTAATAGAKKQLGMMRASASRLRDVVTNALELSEGEQRKLLSEPSASSQKVSFAAVAEEVVTMARLAVDKANKPLLKPGVEIKNLMAEQEQIPLVLGNTSRCTQLLYNLVMNACKFTAAGSVSLSCTHLADASELEIRVVDTGVGLPPEALEKIFLPFEQERSSSSQGLGLGLAVCKAIAEAHGGRIQVQSEPGKGSSFIVTLPCTGDFCDRVEEVLTPRLAEAAGAQGAAAPSEVAGPLPILLSIGADDKTHEALAQLAGRWALSRCPDARAARDWLKDKAAPSPRGEAPTPAVPAESTSSATRRATDSEEIQALKEELARYRSKQQYVRERLAMQLRLDAALQSQDWKTVNQVPTMSRAASGEPT